MTTLAHVPVPVLEPPAAGGPVRLMGYACSHCGIACPSDSICHAKVRRVVRRAVRPFRLVVGQLLPRRARAA